MKSVSARDLSFKTEMDPHNLMNPGKFDIASMAAATQTDTGASLPSTGWRYRETAGYGVSGKA